jgi:iron complex outermembrane recepter protein
VQENPVELGVSVEGRAVRRRLGVWRVFLTTMALGVVTAASVASAQPSVAQATRTFDIPAQPLTDALVQFGHQSGLQVAADGTVAASVRTQAVRGTYTPSEALSRLLAGTGLTFQYTSASTIQVRSAAASGSGAFRLDPVRVQAHSAPPQAEIGNLPPPYAGGQVARGGKVGLLGNRDYMDTPFAGTVYTEKYIEDQQARTLTDVLAGDPTVRLGWPNGNVFDDRTMIRGIMVLNSNYGLGGLYGIVPGQVDVTGIERVEVFHGPTAFLNGALPNAVGGTINLVPKRATDEPINHVAALYLSDGQLGGTADVGRRFGPDNAVGVRAGATYINGNTTVNNQTAERLALTLGLDYRGEDTRMDADIGYLKRDVDSFQGSLFLAPGIQLPPAPYARKSSYQPWETLRADDLYGALRFEHDLTPHLTGFLKVGAKRSNIKTVFFNQRIIDYSGNTDTAFGAGQFLQNTEVLSAEVGARANFRTGALKHEAAIVGDYMFTQIWSFNNPLAIAQNANIYNPIYLPPPSLFGLRDSAPLSSDSLFTSVGLVDAISMADDRIQLIVGARGQRLQTANYSALTGMPTSGNDTFVISPSASFVVKPLKELAIYGNYIQALQQGPVAGAGLTNAGQSFPPFVTRQFELGAKVDLDRIGATLSAFQITVPSAFTDLSTNSLVVNGEQRNRGLEFTMFGEPFAGFRLLGGFTLLEAIQTSTQGGLNNGKRAVGTAPFQASLTADWDTPFAKGVGVMGRVVYNGQVYLDAANTQQAPPWTRFDAGLRYTFERPDGKPISLRANVINLFDANYWMATTSFFAQNLPRTFMLSLAADF